MSIPVIFPATPQGNLRHIYQKLQQNYDYTHNCNYDLLEGNYNDQYHFRSNQKYRANVYCLILQPILQMCQIFQPIIDSQRYRVIIISH